MNNTMPHCGGAALERALRFVQECRAVSPTGNYPHVGDLQWWCRDGSLDDQECWHFWQDQQQRDIALAIVTEYEIQYFLHPLVREDAALYNEVRHWARQRAAQLAGAEGRRRYEIAEEAAEDEPERCALLERNGCTRRVWYHLRYYRELDLLPAAPVLPEGYIIRHVYGEAEVVARAALHRDSFFPYTSRSYEEATTSYLGAMRMPGYDPALDLVVVAPDKTLAAGCICWLDERNRVGLFEPVGTHPEYRRQGLATALMWEGLRRLYECGVRAALVAADHPGDVGKSIFPREFTSARFIYERVGFHLLRRVYMYLCKFGEDQQ